MAGFAALGASRKSMMIDAKQSWMGQTALEQHERLERLEQGDKRAKHMQNRLLSANQMGGNKVTAEHLKTSVSAEDAKSSLHQLRNRVKLVRPGLVPLGKEAEFLDELKLYHAENGNAVFERHFVTDTIQADNICCATSRMALDEEKYPVLAAMCKRLRAALAASDATIPAGGKAGRPEASMLIRELPEGTWSTPHADSGIHFDHCTLTYFPGASEAQGQAHLSCGVRLVFTVGCPNVTTFYDLRGGFAYSIEAPGAGAGIAMPTDVRGFLEGAETRYLHEGPAHSLSGEPMPGRIQILVDLAVADMRAINAALDRFRLGDLIQAGAGTPGLAQLMASMMM